MSHSPVVCEQQPLTKPTSRHVEAAGTQWARFVAITTDPDMLAVVAVCAIGLLLAFNLILRFPDLGIVIEQYNQF